MFDASGEGNETAGEVQGAGQAPAPEVPPQQQGSSVGGTAAPVSQPWKVKIGDTEYDEQSWKTRGVEDLKRLHGEFTRSRQELAESKNRSSAGEYLLEMVRNDPALWAEVRRRIANGETTQQAVQNTAEQADPRIQSVEQRLDSMEQLNASQEFLAAHDDLDDAGEEWITNWIAERSDKLSAMRQAGWSYKDVLENAYAHYVVSKRPQLEAQALQQGQQLKEKEIQNGRKQKSLGTVSPTAQAAPQKKGPTSKMRPADRTETAMQFWQKNARKG
jgi:acyl carrier protein phosphodiesterase